MITRWRPGFTLMELLIAVTIIGVLSMLAYSNYQSYLIKSRRAEGQAGLLHLANLMERHFSVHHTYANASIGTGEATDVLSSNSTEHDWYQLSISAQSATGYTLSATPQQIQATQDILCAVLSLDHLGVKGNSGTGSISQCWG